MFAQGPFLVGRRRFRRHALFGATMLSILVCHSYFLRLDQKQLERGKPYTPLATLQVAAMLRNAGHRESLFYAMLAEVLDYDIRMHRDYLHQLVIYYEG